MSGTEKQVAQNLMFTIRQ